MRNSVLLVVVCLLFVAGTCGLTCAGSIDSPIAHWTFDEASSTTAYDSAGDNDGTLVNGVSRTQGKIGGALDFDGTNDYVDCGNSTILGQFQQMTLSAWVYVHEFSTGTYQARIMSKRHWPDNSYDFGIGTSDSIGVPTVAVGFYGSNDIVALHSTGYNLQTGQWYLVTATNTGTTQRLYINGTKVNETNVNTGPILANNVPLQIGRYSDNYRGTPFNGLIDDVRIYDYALSGQEVALLVPEPVTILFLGLGAIALRKRK